MIPRAETWRARKTIVWSVLGPAAVVLFLGCVPAPPPPEKAPDDYVDVETGTLLPRPPDPTPDRIVFSVSPGTRATPGQEELYSMYGNGTGATRLTNNAEVDYRARWSPEATLLAENCGIHVCTMNADGTEKTVISGGAFIREMEPEWSPNGEFVVWAALDEANQLSLNTTEIATGAIERLSLDTERGSMPAWCGGTIVFSKDSDPTAAFDRELFLFDAGGTLTRLTNSSDRPMDPAWSADCTMIAYHTSTGAGVHQLRIVDVASRTITYLDTVWIDTRGFRYDLDAVHPTWSPDMSRIAFSGTLPGDVDGADIYTVAIDDDHVVNLTESSLHEAAPDWGLPPPNLFFESPRIAVGEAAGTAALTVQLSGASSVPVTVSVDVRGDTATSASDFTGETQVLTFAAGETTKTVSVPILNDSAVESNESFFVELSSPSAALVYPGDVQAVVTITDDDSSAPPPPPPCGDCPP